jgi:hypothetical protein
VAAETGPAGVRALLLAQAQAMSAERVAAARWMRACLSDLGAQPSMVAGDSPEDGGTEEERSSADCPPAHWLPSLLARQRELRLLTPPGDLRDYRLARLAQEVADAAAAATAPGPCAQLTALLAPPGAGGASCACAEAAGSGGDDADARGGGAGGAHAGWAGAPAQLLAAMCDGRLLPTPWLDAYGQGGDLGVPRSSLARLEYAYDAPRLTREEAAFPELFRVAIEGKEAVAAREAAAAHLSSLSLPVERGGGQERVAMLPPSAE